MFYFVIGTIIGSFLCLVAQRFPQKQAVIFARSTCAYCQTPLNFYEMIPILSILWLKFRCRTCQQTLSPIYLFSECLFGYLFWFCFQPTFNLISLLWLTSAILFSLIDWHYYLLEWALFLPLTILLWISLFMTNAPFQLSTFVIFCLLAYLGQTYAQNYIGGGDLVLFIAWFPWLTLIQITKLLMIASISALLFQYLRVSDKEEIPFIPFISLGLFFSYF